MRKWHVMSEYENSEQGIHEPAAFGQQLMLAREKAGMTIEEAARAMNLKVRIVEALEDSDMDRLPPVTFVQGYIRSYAKLLGLSEEKILKEFEEEVPHPLEAELQPRPPSPDGANSQTPIIKLTSLLVVVVAIGVLAYSVYSFYMERTQRIELAHQAAEDPVVSAPLVEQQAALDAEKAPVQETGKTSATEAEWPAPVVDEAPASDSAEQIQADVEPVETAPDQPVAGTAADVSIEEIIPVARPQPITGGDVLTVSAEQECWADISDANDIRMFYGTIEPGRELELVGQAPFDVFLGNAPAVTLNLNSVNVDMTNYIRSNNIAQFKLSVEDGRVRFR